MKIELSLLLLLLGASPGHLSAHTFTLNWHTWDGGGGSCSGGIAPAGGAKYAMTATVGQPDAGTCIVGTYVQQGGFVPAFTKPVTLKVERWVCKDNPMNKKPMCGGNASATVKRTDFGMKFGVPAIGDEIRLWFSVEGYKD